MRRSAVRAVGAVALVVAAGVLGACDSGGGAAEGGRRYLVLPGDTPGLAVAEGNEPGEAYASGIVRPDGTSTAAIVQPTTMVSVEELTAGAPTATLPNGLEVAYVCGGRAFQPGPDGRGIESPEIYGPLTVVAEVDGDVLTIQDAPTDTGRCVPPTVVEGPLVDVAASLRWVDEAEFRRLADDHPGPARTTPPTTG